MLEFFESPIFGLTRKPTSSEEMMISILTVDLPVSVFQALNNRLNSLGLVLRVDTLPTKEQKP